MLYDHTLEDCLKIEKEKARQWKSRCKKAGLALVSFSILALVLTFVILQTQSQGNVMNLLHSGSVYCYRKGRFTYSLFKIKKLHIL